MVPIIIGIIIAALTAFVFFSGSQMASKISSVIVPIMAGLYILVGIVVIVMNLDKVPAAASAIVASAFNFEAIFGGFAGSCVVQGIKRGLFSNEAGMGSAPNAAATADVSHPAKQGLVQMLSVFLDTLLICTATAFMCLSSGVEFNADMGGAAYVQSAMAANLGGFGPVFLSVAMSLFAFTTLIGNYSYCEGCLRFILNREVSKTGILAFRILATFLVFLGAVASASTVWNLADMTQGLMVIVNVPVILILMKPAMKCLDDYCKQKAEGKNPVFVAKNAGIDDKGLEFWK
jgi:AGCS family alanine or glycine:cation symporter